MRREGSTSYETEFKGTPPFTLTSLDGYRAIGSWPGPGASQVVLTILQLDNLVTNAGWLLHDSASRSAVVLMMNFRCASWPVPVRRVFAQHWPDWERSPDRYPVV